MKRNFNLLSEKELQRRKLTLKAIEDYFGVRISQDSFERIAKSLKTNSTLGLDEEERRAVWTIKTNLADPIYMANLALPQN